MLFSVANAAVVVANGKPIKLVESNPKVTIMPLMVLKMLALLFMFALILYLF